MILVIDILLQGNASDEEDNTFASLSRFVPSRSPVTMADELTAYLGSPPEQPDGGDALQQRVVYRRLSLMALDFLSIPCKCEAIYISTVTNKHTQRRPLTSSDHSAGVVIYCRIATMRWQHQRPAASCYLVHGSAQAS